MYEQLAPASEAEQLSRESEAAAALLSKYATQAEEEGVQLFAQVSSEPDWGVAAPLGPQPFATSTQLSVAQVGLQSASAVLNKPEKGARPLSARSAASELKSAPSYASDARYSRSPEREREASVDQSRRVLELEKQLRAEQLKNRDLRLQLDSARQHGLTQHRLEYARSALLESIARSDFTAVRLALRTIPGSGMGSTAEAQLGLQVCRNSEAGTLALREALGQRNAAQVEAWVAAAPLLGIADEAVLAEAHAMLGEHEEAVRAVWEARDKDPAILSAALLNFDSRQWAQDPDVVRQARIIAGAPPADGSFQAAMAERRVRTIQATIRTMSAAVRTGSRQLDRYNAALTRLATADDVPAAIAAVEEWTELDDAGLRALQAAREQLQSSTGQTEDLGAFQATADVLDPAGVVA
jgi:hypothetical protein